MFNIRQQLEWKMIFLMFVYLVVDRFDDQIINKIKNANYAEYTDKQSLVLCNIDVISLGYSRSKSFYDVFFFFCLLDSNHECMLLIPMNVKDAYSCQKCFYIYISYVTFN